MTTQKRQLSEFAMSEPGLDAVEPQIDNAPVADGGHDREGAMAKADLYKLASYSHKLYQQIQDDQQLEAWVQAKITKAADYIASVYHYLEYEMKFSEYGKHLDNAETMSESQREALKGKLMEARQKMKQLKVAQAEKVTEATKTPSTWTDKSGKTHPATKVKGDKYTGKEAEKEAKKTKEVDEGFDKDAKPGDTFKTGTGGTATKTKTGLKHTAGKNYSGKGASDEAKKSKKDDDLEEGFEKDAKVGDTFKTGTGGTATKTKTGLKHTAGKNYSGKAASAEEKKKDKDLDEAAPSADLTKKEKSAVVKKAKKGGDIGKPGKNFGKVAAAAKKGGAKDPKAVAAAAMWKNVKEGVKVAEAAKKADKDYDGDGKVESGKDEHAGSVDNAIKASKAKKTVKESADFSRMQDQLARLNRSETHVLKESSEADQIRALAKLLG